MKNITRQSIVTLLFFYAILSLARSVFAQTEMFYVDEKKKALIDKRQNMEAVAHETGNNKNSDEPKYAQEGRIISNQLEIITGNEETKYYIVKGDTISVVFSDRGVDTKANYKVSESGEIVMPLVGSVKVAGLNRKEAREFINNRLMEYIRHPNVRIKINDAGNFLVLGAVGSPGVYKLSSNLSILEAILYSGYIEGRAKLNSVIVIRGSYENPETIKLNLKKMIKKGDRSDNLPVKPGDIIYVPTTYIARLDDFKNTALELVFDWYSLGGTAPFKNP